MKNFGILLPFFIPCILLTLVFATKDLYKDERFNSCFNKNCVIVK